MDEAEAADELQHVLAFLDTYGLHNDSDWPMQSTRGGEVEEVSTWQCKHPQRLAAKARYRDRIKEEHSRLRNEARELEAKLTQLQGPSDIAQVGDEGVEQPPLSAWRENSALHEAHSSSASATRATAVREYKRQKQVEAVNFELKTLLSKDEKACGSTAAAWDRVLTKKVRPPAP